MITIGWLAPSGIATTAIPYDPLDSHFIALTAGKGLFPARKRGSPQSCGPPPTF
jgi:hypothetical protein